MMHCVRARVLDATLVILLIAGWVAGSRDVGAQTAGQGGSAGTGRAAGGDLETTPLPRGLPVELERNPGRGPALHEPVFLERATTETERTRFGPSAWIAPGAPFEHRENPGGPAIGFSFTWRPLDMSVAGPGSWHGSAAR